MLAPWLWEQNLAEAIAFFLVLNIAIVFVSMLLWYVLRAVFRSQPVFDSVKPVTRTDLIMVTVATVMNVVVSIAGWGLWKAGYIHLAEFTIGRALLDFALLLILMDLGMYLTHRIAHIPAVYKSVHHRHHEHVETNALSLFVLSPLEVLGFGGLLVGVTALLGPSEPGLSAYLAMNLIVGTIGHVGVEPLPASCLSRLPGGLLGTSTFHALHHIDRTSNFGFYTTVWDRLGRTFNLK